MARILILQEEPSPYFALRTALESKHELIIVSSVEEALWKLNSDWIDLIISRVHLVKDSIFDFLRSVKEDRYLRYIPFICFCGKLGQHTLTLDPLMAKLGSMYGAEKYISLQEYCCDDSCDFRALQQTIEDCLGPNLRDSGAQSLEPAEISSEMPF